ncbi:TatD family hydrolase [Candidatus Micrarchaeota archaeon]|nr:TatD family hydrolase [Candidatus Micrarchaeota archaeon]
MTLVDSHTHLYDMKKGYELPADILPVVAGYSHSSNRKAVELRAQKGYPIILGIAPQTAIKKGIEMLDEWVDFIRQNKPNGIGEVGLDYKWAQTKEDVEHERAVFERMVSLAREMDLPLVIHSRNNPNPDGGEVPKDAVDDILPRVKGLRVLMHFYSGSEEQAGKIVADGGYISVTHMRSKERRKVINIVPLDRLVVESDCPYVGKSPESIREAVAYIAEVKGLDVGKVGQATAENAARFFNFRL